MSEKNSRRFLTGGKTVKFDGNVVLEESWQVPQNDRVIIVNGKAKKRVNIARNGALSLYIGDKHKMTHSHRALGLYESVRPVIIWLNDGTLLKVVDKTDPFEDLANEEKEAYLGQAWKKSPLPDACADLFIVHEFAAVLHYPGHGTCYMSPKTATGYQAWVQIPISDVHHAYSDGRRLLLVTRDVNTYTIVDGHTFQTLMTVCTPFDYQVPSDTPKLSSFRSYSSPPFSSTVDKGKPAAVSIGDSIVLSRRQRRGCDNRSRKDPENVLFCAVLKWARPCAVGSIRSSSLGSLHQHVNYVRLL